MDTIKLFRRLAVVLFAVGSLALLWNWNYVPGGVFKASWTPDGESPFIYDWGPLSSFLRADKNKVLAVSGERVTFKIKTPAEFSKAEVVVRYEEPKAKEIFLSALSGPWSLPDQRRLLYSEFLENLDWPLKASSGLMLWEQASSGKSVPELFQSGNNITTVGMRAAKNIKGFPGKEKTYSVSLRGAHTFWILPGGGSAEMVFKIQNMNRNPGPDPIVIEARSGGAVLKKTVLDLSAEDDAVPGGLETIRFSIPGAGASTEIKFLATDDIFIREIVTDAPRMVLEGRIFLGDSIGYGGRAFVPTLWTNSPGISVRTPHKEGRQTISFAGRALDIPKSGESFYMRLKNDPAGIVPIRLQREDVDINVSGFVSLIPEDFFIPTWPEARWDTRAPESGAIIAEYALAEKKEGALVSKIVFDFKDLYKEEDGGYRLFLEIFGDEEKEFRVKSVSLKAYR